MEDLADEVDTICAVLLESGRRGQLEVAVASLAPRRRQGMQDLGKFALEVFEFADSAQLSNLESLLVRLKPARLLHPELPASQGVEQRKLENMCTILSVQMKSCKRKLFVADDFEVDLCTLLGTESLAKFSQVLELKRAVRAAAGLVRHESLLGGDDASGSVTLHVGSLNQFVKLDAAAVKALNLLPGPDDANKESSVHGVLDHCVTRYLGPRLLAQWLRQPLLDMDRLRARQRLVSSLNDDTDRRQAIRQCLKSVPDLDRITRRFETNRANLEDMYKLYMFAKGLPSLRNAMRLADSDEDAESESDALHDFVDRIEHLLSPERFGMYTKLAESVIDFDVAPREFRVQTRHDTTGELEEIKMQCMSVEEELVGESEDLQCKELRGMTSRFSSDPKAIKTHGHHFMVNKKHDNELKKLKVSSGYRYIGVVSKGIIWTTDRLSELSKKLQQLNDHYGRAQAKVVRNACGVAKTYLPLVEMAATQVAELDVLCSLAHVAAHSPTPYSLPKLQPLGEGDLVISQGRHPCMELQEDVNFIANDYMLRRETSRFQIITGPNMGGKSTYIRQLGVIAVMAQIGSFVPCDEAELPLLDAVMARVGASDAQMRGVSTFMAEMIEASSILNTASENSLVIIDELGRGTSTYDGFGLAWAISEHLVKESKSFCLFATHFHELTVLENQLSGVTNRHVTAKTTDESLTMLYEVQTGACDRSFGINIARLAGFPDDVIQDAKTKVEQLEAVGERDSRDERSSKRQKLSKPNEEALRCFVREFAAIPFETTGVLELKQRVAQLVKDTQEERGGAAR